MMECTEGTGCAAAWLPAALGHLHLLEHAALLRQPRRCGSWLHTSTAGCPHSLRDSQVVCHTHPVLNPNPPVQLPDML